MKKVSKTLALILALSLAFSCIGVQAFADDEPLYVNYGDSIAWGRIENEDQYPGYDFERDSYSGRFASYLGTSRVSYARRGMQTTDILYMIDDQFKADVDNGVISPDSWWINEYPPYDGVSLDEVKENTAKADYMTLCVGVCDYISYPGDVKTAKMDQLPSEDEAKAKLSELLAAGTIDEETYNAFMALMEIYTEKTVILISYILDMLKGYADFINYYPRIVADLRAMNEDAAIILIGNYLPGGSLTFLIETPEASPIIFYLNRLLDNVNLVVKQSAEKYGCLYVDTMGIDSDWHPTVNGHQQICDRIVSVLNGDPTYAGNVALVNKIVKAVANEISKVIEKEVKKAYALNTLKKAVLSNLFK